MAVLQKRDRPPQQPQASSSASSSPSSSPDHSHRYQPLQLAQDHHHPRIHNDDEMKFIGGREDITNSGGVVAHPATYRIPLDDEDDVVAHQQSSNAQLRATMASVRSPPPSYGLRGGGGDHDGEISVSAPSTNNNNESHMNSSSNSNSNSNNNNARVITDADYEDAYEPKPAYTGPYQGNNPSSSSSSSRSFSPTDDDELHAFWLSWWWLLKGVALLFAGAFTMPLVIMHGVVRLLWSVPVRLGDDTTWRWPEITGVPSGCAAGLEALFCLGLYQGLTDWAVLPVRLGRKRGFTAALWGFGMGCTVSIVCKLPAGALALVGHPMYGIFKEFTKIRLSVRREKPRRTKTNVSPV